MNAELGLGLPATAQTDEMPAKQAKDTITCKQQAEAGLRNRKNQRLPTTPSAVNEMSTMQNMRKSITTQTSFQPPAINANRYVDQNLFQCLARQHKPQMNTAETNHYSPTTTHETTTNNTHANALCFRGHIHFYSLFNSQIVRSDGQQQRGERRHSPLCVCVCGERDRERVKQRAQRVHCLFIQRFALIFCLCVYIWLCVHLCLGFLAFAFRFRFCFCCCSG